MNPIAQAFIGITLFAIWEAIITEYTQRKYAKKCGYNCEICKNWKCQVHYCKKKRAKEIEE